MTRSKYPIEYELGPETLEKGEQWLTLWLKNEGDEKLHNLDIKMHSTDSLNISFRSPNAFVHLLNPNEEKFLYFQVDAYATTALYISIRYFKSGGSFHWDSPWIRKKVLGEVAELKSVLVSNPYGIIGRELDIEATVKGLSNSDGLDLYSGQIHLLQIMKISAKIKTKKLSSGEEASYVTKITPREEGYYTVYANLYDNGRRIDRDSETLWVEK